MNGPGDISLSQPSATPDIRPCGLISIIPVIGMSSCRGRAEAFARKLSSKLRTLGVQNDGEPISQDEESIINGSSENTWITTHDDEEHIVTNIQPLPSESDSFFAFDCEAESPGSPVDECEYLRLIETPSNTPHNAVTDSECGCEVERSCRILPYEANLSPDEIKTNTEQLNSTRPCKNCSCKGVTPNYCGSIEKKSNLQKNDFNTETYSQSNLTAENCVLINDRLPKPELTIQDSITVKDDIFDVLPNETQTVPDIETNDICFSEEENKREDVDESRLVNIDFNEDEESGKSDLGLIEPRTEKSNENLTNFSLSCSPDITTIDCKEIYTTIASAGTTLIPSKIGTQSLTHLEVADTTDDEDDCRPQRVRRCSSLKTGKTPPGTPGRKKIVRFADVLGLDLADVKTFLDEIPTIPKSAFEDLEIMESELPIQIGPKSEKLLMPLFQQPGGLPTFLDSVREKQVSLENAAVTDHINQTVTGSVRVRNLDFHKSVHIRYSLDNWRSFADLQANYADNSCDGFSDKFTFILFGNSLQIGQRLEFAVRFQCKGQQFWDNNYGANYCFQCLPTSTSTTPPIQAIEASRNVNNLIGILSPTAGDAWCSSFY